jgi:hypothetical protein
MKNTGSIEKFSIFGAIFFFAFGVGLLVDGKKLHQTQVRLSERVDYKSTLNPYQ